MDDFLVALLQPIRELLGLDDDGSGVLPAGGSIWIAGLTVVSLVGACLLWLWLA